MAGSQAFTFCPEWLVADGASGVPRSMRPFGACAEDLAIEFDAARRPDLITELLENCCRADGDDRADRSILLRMPVGMRIEALLALASLTDNAALSWQTRCQTCGQEIEFDLSLEEIAALGEERRALATCETEIGGRRVTLRRPTGADQIEWATSSEGERPGAMLRSIVTAPSLDALLANGASLEALETAVDAAMDTFDPLVGFHLHVTCPDCGSAADVSPDLAALALDRLSRAQQMLISEVHLLASRYHWSEKDVLELPHWRRERYIELIEDEG